MGELGTPPPLSAVGLLNKSEQSAVCYKSISLLLSNGCDHISLAACHISQHLGTFPVGLITLLGSTSASCELKLQSPMPSTRIILLCIASATFYGVIHDQFTARICIEYFTVAHEHVIDTNSPTLLGLYFGFAATWWVGLLATISISNQSHTSSQVGQF